EVEFHRVSPAEIRFGTPQLFIYRTSSMNGPWAGNSSGSRVWPGSRSSAVESPPAPCIVAAGEERPKMERLLATLLALGSLVMPAWAFAQAHENSEQDWTAPRTEWGDPDLRGKWPIDVVGQTPRERPKHFGTR